MNVSEIKTHVDSLPENHHGNASPHLKYRGARHALRLFFVKLIAIGLSVAAVGITLYCYLSFEGAMRFWGLAFCALLIGFAFVRLLYLRAKNKANIIEQRKRDMDSLYRSKE